MDKKSQTADPQHETYWATKTRQPEAEIRGAKRYLSLFQKLWGKDVFISYSRADGAGYALALAAQLSERGFACVIDQ